MLVLSRQEGESIIIGDNIKVTVLRAKIGHARLGIDAPKHISVHREEVYKAIKAGDKEVKPMQ